MASQTPAPSQSTSLALAPIQAEPANASHRLQAAAPPALSGFDDPFQHISRHVPVMISQKYLGQRFARLTQQPKAWHRKDPVFAFPIATGMEIQRSTDDLMRSSTADYDVTLPLNQATRGRLMFAASRRPRETEAYIVADRLWTPLQSMQTCELKLQALYIAPDARNALLGCSLLACLFMRLEAELSWLKQRQNLAPKRFLQITVPPLHQPLFRRLKADFSELQGFDQIQICIAQAKQD